MTTSKRFHRGMLLMLVVLLGLGILFIGVLSRSRLMDGIRNKIPAHDSKQSARVIKAAVDFMFKGTNLTKWSTVYQNQLKRQLLLVNVCKELGMGFETPDFRKLDILVNDTMKFLYCIVPKVACTTWKRLFLMASGQMDVERVEDLNRKYVHDWEKVEYLIPRIRNYTLDQIKARLLTHFKFVFVRHPLERLVSAYRDKFGRPPPGNESTEKFSFHKYFGTKIIRATRPNATSESLERGHDVKFREMIRYLLDGSTDKYNLQSNGHWRQQHLLCHPCHVGYNFIGHYETLADDARFVLDRLGLADRLRFPDKDPDNMWKLKTAQIAAKHFGELEPRELERVRELYEYDFRLFGFDDRSYVG